MDYIENCFAKKNTWTKLGYNQQPFTSLGETPFGGTWPLIFFKRTPDGGFTTIKGDPVAFNIKAPDYFDMFWQEQAQITMNACSNITETEKKVAIYWGKGEPHNQFIPILQTLINTYKLQVVNACRLYAIVNNALNDAAIICWYYKYLYQIPRPVQYYQSFTSFLPTPQHPSYPAGHSVIPGTFIKIVSHFFPAEKDKLYALFEQCSFSRIYAGVHYPLDVTEGNKLGEQIGELILEQIKNDTDKYGTTVNWIFTEFKDAPINPII